MQPEYVVAYNILDEGIGWQRMWPVLGWLAGLVIAGCAWRHQLRERKYSAVLFMSLWLAFWICGGIFGVSNVVIQQVKCINWAKSGEFEVVEGEVRDFKPMPAHGHTNEVFTVSGVRFSYSDYDLSRGGFNNATSHGGPIREGLPVRIAHRDGRILKIEVRK